MRIIKKIKERKSWSVIYIPPKNTYEKIICLGGFGHSGSGALLDLLSEFENTTTIGYHDTNDGSQAKNEENFIEFDILRRYGGIFDLAEAFTTRNSNVRDFKLKNFITLVEYFYRKGGIFNDEFMNLTNDFIDKLIDFKIKTVTGCEANPAFLFKKGKHANYKNLTNPYLLDGSKDRYCFFLKDMGKDDYFHLAHRYVESILKTIESRDYLILDQAVSDDNADFDTIHKILGAVKTIFVLRDPRDVYMTALSQNACWIPRDAHDFIKWYRHHTKAYISCQHKDFLLINFEDLVLNYEKTVSMILKFLDISANHHSRKKQFFEPAISAKNVGLWQAADDKDSIKLIEKGLKQFCKN